MPRWYWVPQGTAMEHNMVTSALPKLAREWGRQTSAEPPDKDFQRSPQPQSSAPVYTVLNYLVPTEGSWTGIGTLILQMRKLRLERGQDWWCLQVRKLSGWNPEFQPLRFVLLPIPRLFRLKNRVPYKDLCLHDLLSLWYRGVSASGSLHTAVS